MDVAGSFLELACVRVALLPAGAAMPDHRFEELTSHLTAFRELPVNALPRRAAVPRTSGNATFSSMPTDFREALADSSPTTKLHRSRSMSRDVARPPTAPKNPSIDTLRNSFEPHGDPHPAQRNFSSTRVAPHAVSFRKTRSPTPVSPRHTADLDMTRPDVDSSFRLRYDIVHRDNAGELIMKPFSEWDDFHSSKIWGVFGIVDCTQPGICENAEERQRAILHAYDDFTAALPNFKHAAIRRLIVFIAPNTDHENGPFVLNDPKQSVKNPKDPLYHFSVGYVPEHDKLDETRMEVKAQIIHFSGLLLHAVDKDCWKMRESPGSELFRSPIDEKHNADRQSKLTKRRAGRLDKLLGDSLLLMGSPAEAIVKYNSAIEKAKANSDRLFLAGAMEGWSAARVLTFVGNGGSISDAALSDELIEHYGEIYKWYQKKRVAEPEAAAALRLAEFLGKWTNRRKDALDAAEHAATVGEGLKVQKRAALWEALARFSERMGCRRKAALFLYRLGLLNGNMSVWSSAVTLMIACERQLSRDGRKPWASLNRNVILNAAHYADEAGDVSTAARLYAEALVIAPQALRDGRQADENIISALISSQVPPYLPAAKDMVYLGEMLPLQLHDLSIRLRNNVSSGEEFDVVYKDGPFIYNPFEAKKRAKAAAVAQRAVTWVCGEPAYISVRLVNKIGADLVVQVIAIVLSENQTDEEDESGIDEDSFSESLESYGIAQEDENSYSQYTTYVRRILGQSEAIAKTIPDSFTIPWSGTISGLTKQITVIPKRMGALHVRGLVVRLFNGAIVTLQTDEGASGKAPPVNVISNLPRIDISTHSIEGGSLESISNGAPLVVYEGERRVFRIRIENTGVDSITWMKAKVRSSNPDILTVSSHDLLNDDVWHGLEDKGKFKFFDVEVLGRPRRRKRIETSSDRDASTVEDYSRRTALTVISISVEYEGKQSSDTIRESSCFLRLLSKPAVRIASILVLPSPFSSSGEGSNIPSSYCIALEISNDTGAPAAVNVVHSNSSYGDIQPATEAKSDPHNFLGTECFVECGASARLICPLPDETTHRLRETVTDTEHQTKTMEENDVFTVKWRLPALGRFGELDISHWDIWRALVHGRSRKQQGTDSFCSASCAKYLLMQAELRICLQDGTRSDNSHVSDDVTDVAVGRFCRAVVHVRNMCNTEFPKGTRLDIDLLQMDDQGSLQKVRRAVVVGAVEKVDVEPMQPDTGSFEHVIMFKVHSRGTFHLQACLYDSTAPNPTLPASKSSKSTNMPLSERSSSNVQSRSNSVSGNLLSAAEGELDSEQTSATVSQGRGGTQDLESVGVPRKVPAQTEKAVGLNLLYPTTIDSYPESAFKNTRGDILGCAMLQFSAVSSSTSAQARTGLPTNSAGNLETRKAVNVV